MSTAIKSMLDDDLYKFTMANAIHELYPNEIAEYKFYNRGKHKFNKKFANALTQYINMDMTELAVTDDELQWFKQTCPYIKPAFFELLLHYRYDPSEVNIIFSDNYEDMEITIKGLWYRTVLWEVKLLALISKFYFALCDTNWESHSNIPVLIEKRIVYIMNPPNLNLLTLVQDVDAILKRKMLL